MVEPKSFTISRKDWARGAQPVGRGRGYVGNSDGQCCLGHWGLACGLIANPHQEPCFVENKDYCAWQRPPELWTPIIRINDSIELSEPKREAQLIRAFAEVHGTVLTFVD